MICVRELCVSYRSSRLHSFTRKTQISARRAIRQDPAASKVITQHTIKLHESALSAIDEGISAGSDANGMTVVLQQNGQPVSDS